ncbi:IclR family transcriptional regulator [Haloferax namakaokahaiae]|uniref:IclR family transcriptional regulator n=1 Tax=Haloferax namakaokahaiae TaxID=1748331 RepID=A0ABD5ZCY1_9EURY
MNDTTPPLRTIQRAFEIIDLLMEEKSIGVAELSRRMDLPKSTVHDYLRTLRTMGYVINDDGQYRLGFKLLELGGRMKYRNRLFHVAKPELERLVEKTGELVSVNIEESGRFVVLHMEEGDESLSLGIYPGISIPIHTHAAGKVMLAGFDEEKVDRIIEEKGLEAVTEHTITDSDELKAELEQIREQGFGVDLNQQVVGMGVVAAPIQVKNRVIGSVGVVCPTDRLLDEAFRQGIAQEVQKCANIISVNYQYSP